MQFGCGSTLRVHPNHREHQAGQAEPDAPVTLATPAVARPGEGVVFGVVSPSRKPTGPNFIHPHPPTPGDTLLPKGPFRTKNTTTIVKIVNYYAIVFLLRPPNLVRRGHFFERKNVCNSQENGVRTRCAAIVNHPAVLKILRVVNFYA